MNNKTFKPGQAVFYKPKDSSGKVYKVEAGIVKRMSDDGKHAFVWYHSGCTAARTPIEDLEVAQLGVAHKGIHRGCKECKSTVKCCICGKEIVDEIHDGNNPDPLKDENGKFLADDPVNNLCCSRCNRTYATPFRICSFYKEEKQCELIQAKVLELRKGWLKK